MTNLYTRKDMALSAISMDSALADKEFVLSLHHKLHVSTCINKPNDVHKHNQSIIQSINQSFLHKQQWNLPPWWNYLQVFIQRRSLIRQNRIRQILPFKLRPLTAQGTYRAWFWLCIWKQNRPWDYRNLLYLPDAYILFKAARTPTLLKAGTTLSARAVPSAPLFLHVDSNVW